MAQQGRYSVAQLRAGSFLDLQERGPIPPRRQASVARPAGHCCRPLEFHALPDLEPRLIHVAEKRGDLVMGGVQNRTHRGFFQKLEGSSLALPLFQEGEMRRAFVEAFGLWKSPIYV